MESRRSPLEPHPWGLLPKGQRMRPPGISSTTFDNISVDRQKGLARIQGLTKMAKLDFFVRYPQFFETVRTATGGDRVEVPGNVDSPMVRHHYGPWDKRYYHTLAYLEGRGLLTVSRVGGGYELSLTEAGNGIAARLERDGNFAALCVQMRAVKKTLGSYTGSRLKRLIYEVFEHEVASRSLGQEIK
jgi:hypothetical protein